MMRVYVAAPYNDAARVRYVHACLRARGAVPTSLWADRAHSPEDLGAMDPRDRAGAIAANDTGVATADVLIALPRIGAGGEMFAEVRLATLLSIPVLWVGERLTLSAFRDGVSRFDGLRDALDEIEQMIAGRSRPTTTGAGHDARELAFDAE